MTYYTLITFLSLFQKIDFRCSDLHRRSSFDPHPFCEPCALAAGFTLCTPTDTCRYCAPLDKASWQHILAARRKRAYRLNLKLNSPAKSTSAISPAKSPSSSGTSTKKRPSSAQKVRSPSSHRGRPALRDLLPVFSLDNDDAPYNDDLCPTALFEKGVSAKDLEDAARRTRVSLYLLLIEPAVVYIEIVHVVIISIYICSTSR